MRGFILFVMLAMAGGVATHAAEPRPNLVFVFSDQQSWDMLGCYGNRDIKTPVFDRFAAEGVRFNHCVSNSPGLHAVSRNAPERPALAPQRHDFQ